jgi:hypothetical protein
LPAPRTEERFVVRGANCGFEEIGIKHVVVIHENQQLSVSLADAAQTGWRETGRFLSNTSSSRVPGKIEAVRDRFIASIIHHHQFPPVERECLTPQPVEASPEVIRTRIIGTDNDGKHLLEKFKC